MDTTACCTCIKQMKKSDPTVYCSQCDVLMCQSCGDTHNQAVETRNHEVILYLDYQKLPPCIINTNMNCSQHQLKYEEYCRIHDKLTCKECKRIFHMSCEDVLKIEDIVFNIKDSALFHEIFSEIEDLCGTLKEVVDDRNENIEQLKSRHKEIEKTIENKCHNNANLINLKDRTISDLNAVCNELTNDLSNTLQRIHSEKENIGRILHQKDDIIKHATNYQTFIALKEMEKILQQTNVKLNEMKNSKKLHRFNMEFEMKKTVEDLVSCFNSLGMIKVTKSPAAVSIQTIRPKDLGAQKEVQISAHVQLYFQQQIDLKHGWYNGCCILLNGLMVLANYDIDELYIHKSDGSLRSTIKFKNSEVVWGVTPIDDHHVAVSHPTTGTISIIDVNKGFINKGKVVRTLNLGEEVRGLSCRGRDLVCCVQGYGLVRINIDSEEIETVLEDKSVGWDSQIEVNKTHLCYTYPDTHSITVLDIQYNVIFTYKDQTVLRRPAGVTIDDHGYIYVTGRDSHNLVMVSPDGNSCHQLLGKYDGLDDPTAVHYENSTKKLIVVNRNGSAFLFSVEQV